MSIESAKAFYQRVTTDEAFQTQLQSAASEERTVIIQEAGYDFTPEEWETATAQVLEAAEINRELNDVELEAIAGGVSILPVVPVYGVALPLNLNWPPKGPSIPLPLDSLSNFLQLAIALSQLN